MNHEQAQFGINKDGRPFKSPASRSFLKRWCAGNIGQDLNGFLDQVNLKQIHSYDIGNFTKRLLGNKAPRFVDKFLLESAELFKNTGTYIAKRIDYIEEGRKIAELLARGFYNYGNLLRHGNDASYYDIPAIANQELSSSDTEEVDIFIAGEEGYSSRIAKIDREGLTDDQKPERYERERIKGLRQFFRAVELAINLRTKNAGNREKELPEVSDVLLHGGISRHDASLSVHDSFLSDIYESLSSPTREPEILLFLAIFHLGLSGLKEFIIDYAKKMDADMDRLRRHIDNVRSTQTDEVISEEEHYAADTIRHVIRSIAYEPHVSLPVEIMNKLRRNCVGVSALGALLMEEIGINYLVGTLPTHSILLLIKSNGHVEWWDESGIAELTDDKIEGVSPNSPVSVRDIVSFSHGRDQTQRKIYLRVTDKNLVKAGTNRLKLYRESRYGLMAQVMSNLRYYLEESGQEEEAALASIHESVI